MASFLSFSVYLNIFIKVKKLIATIIQIQDHNLFLVRRYHSWEAGWSGQSVALSAAKF